MRHKGQFGWLPCSYASLTTCFRVGIVKRSAHALKSNEAAYAANTQVPDSEEMACKGRKTPVFTYKKFLARTGKAA